MKSTSSIDKFLEQANRRSLLRFSTMGSVDDGKSTLLGRLLHDCKAIYEDQIKSVQASSLGFSNKEIDYSLFTDGLKAEREQGITIDVAYRYFSTPKRSFIVADTPGHEQYTRNMVTGASKAHAALILVDARNGIMTQTKRHSFIASLLGIQKFLVVINKMDLVNFSQATFDKISSDYLAFAAKLKNIEIKFIPVSALLGENVTNRSSLMPWYKGETLLQYLEEVHCGNESNLIDFRFPIQYVLRSQAGYRGLAGQISSGTIRSGDSVLVLPNKNQTKIKSISTFDGEIEEAFAPMSVVLTLEDDIDAGRSNMIVKPLNIPQIEEIFEAMVVWMDEKSLGENETLILKHTSQTTKAIVEKIRYRTNVNSLHQEECSRLEMNEVGRIVFSTHQPLFFDVYEKNRITGSFILMDPTTHSTVGAGMIIDRLTSKLLAEERNSSKESVSTLWLTGLSGSGKTTTAKAVETELNKKGIRTVTLDGDELRNGLSKNLGYSKEDRSENVRRVAEVAKLFNQAGITVIVSLISPYKEDRMTAKDIIGEDRFVEIFMNTPLAICEKRDSKFLYKKARSGEIVHFTGISDRYDQPNEPDLIISTEILSIEQCRDMILDFINNPKGK